ncbi:hypothetical protein C8R47DRAFT_1199601 [Mycena vitilis]|nr:hypothetical protein C8R47DRAFT_1199601 [Mycena vitilis]
MADRPSSTPWHTLCMQMTDTFILSIPILFMLGATTAIGTVVRAILSVPLTFGLCLGSAHYDWLTAGFEPCLLLITIATAIFRGMSMLPPSPLPYVYTICSIPITMSIWNTLLYRAGLGNREWKFTICVGESRGLWSCEVTTGAIHVDKQHKPLAEALSSNNATSR